MITSARNNGVGVGTVMTLLSEIGPGRPHGQAARQYPVAHKLARMAYFMLTRGAAFVDQGQQRYQEQQQQRSVAAAPRH
jgi:hypothetical protein